MYDYSDMLVYKLRNDYKSFRFYSKVGALENGNICYLDL